MLGLVEEVKSTDERIIELLGQLVKAIYGDKKRGLEIYEEKYGALSFYKNFRPSKNVKLIVVKKGEKIVGFASFRIGNEIYVYDIVVDEKERGKGFGRKLIDFIKNYGKPIWVEAIESSKGFFEKMGFKVMKKYVEDEISWYVMRWENVEKR